MKTSDLFGKGRTVFSFEVFPPKRDDPVAGIYSTVERLKDLSPDFISVTYGAGGTKNSEVTLAIASEIKRSGVESVMHLPCVGMTRADAEDCIARIRDAGIQNILALRGDLPEGMTERGDFPHASDLIMEAAAMISCGATLRTLESLIHPHPTLSEIFI